MIFRALLPAIMVLTLVSGGWGAQQQKSSPAPAVKSSTPKSLPLPKAPEPKRTDHLWEDVKSYGAKGDGKTDDTQAIQKAINAAGARTKVVLIPPGVYRTSGPGLRLTASDLTLKGLGKYTSVVQHSGDQPALTVGLGKKPPCLNVKIADLQFQGKNARGHGILLSDWTVRYVIDNVSVADFAMGTAIKAVDHNHSGHISQVDISGNGTGISIGDHGQYTDISFSKIIFNKKYGVELTDCNVINIFSTQLEKNGESKGASVIARGVDALNLIGCYNEQTDTYNSPFLVLTRGVTSGSCRGVNVVGCRSIGNNKAQHSVVLESAQGVNFTGNVMQSFPGGLFALRPLGPNQVRMISGQSNVLNGPLGADIFAVK